MKWLDFAACNSNRWVVMAFLPAPCSAYAMRGLLSSSLLRLGLAMICLLSALCAPASLVSQVRNIEYDPRDMPADERFGGVAAHRPGGGLTPVRDEYDVSIRIGYETGGGYSPNYIEAYLGTFGDTLSWSSGTPSMSGTTTLEPYERYDLWIRSDDPIRFFMLFSPPAGFEIEFERTRTDYARATLDGSDLWNRFDVRLVPTGGASSGGARLGETLVLEFPLGTLPGGEPLGSVTLTQEGPGAALFDRSSLRFFSEHPAVTVYESGGALGLIEAPKYVLVFSDHNDGFSVQYSARVYDQNWGDYIYGAKVKDYLVEPVGTGNDKVRVIERRTSAAGTYEVRRTEYQWNTGVGWNILYDSSARRNLITNYTSTDDYGGSRSEEVTVQDSGTTVGTKYRRAFKNFGSEEYLFKQIRLIDGDEWVTEYDYYTSGTGAAEVAGMIRSVKYADGGWIKYEYSDFGDGGAPRVSKMVKPFENSVFPTSGDGSNTEVTTMSWTSGYDGINSFPATTEVRIGGTLVSKTDNTYIFENSGSEITMEAKDGGGSTRSLYLRETTAYANSSSSIVTKAAYYKGRTGPDGDDPYLANRPVYILEASGSMTFYDYDFGHTFLDTDGRYDGFTPWWSLNKRGWRVIEYSGVNPSFSGSGYGSLSLGITNSPSGWPTSMKLVPGKSTKTVQIWDGRGMLSRTETYVYTTSDWSPTPVAWTDFLYNRNLELETVYQSDFTDGSNDLAVIQREYDNQGRLTAEVGADGSRVEYTYDSLDQVQTQTNVGRATAFTPVSGGPSVALPDVTTTYFYDPAGRVKETRRGTSTEYISNKWGYFESGDLEYEENEFGVRTEWREDKDMNRWFLLLLSSRRADAHLVSRAG
jgi:YD repeat-containing protein